MNDSFVINPMNDVTSQSALGKVSKYVDSYRPALLFPIARSNSRYHLPATLEFHGYDLWNIYELSWLNPQGLPQIAVGTIQFPADSPNLIESKSLKLYLNSLNQTQFRNITVLNSTITQDLTASCGAPVIIKLNSTQLANQITPFTGACLDKLEISIECYSVNPNLLQTTPNTSVTENLYSELFKSNCLVTGQPDWASLHIEYTGNKIDQKSLLKYLISYRNHQGFHEQCVEQIFTDIQIKCSPEKLTVWAHYTRRGGLDINPIRSSHPVNLQLHKIRTPRQ